MNGALGPGQFALGCLLLGGMLAATAGTAVLLVRRRLDHLLGAPRAVAFAVLTLAGVLAVHVVPLALGVLSRFTVLICSGALILAVSRVKPASARELPTPADPATPRELPTAANPATPAGRLGSLSWLIAAAALLLTGASWLGYLEIHATYQPVSVDALSFHLPGVIRFLQTGSLWHTTQYLPGQAQGNYPQYGDVLMLALVLPWRSVALVRYADPLLLGLAALSVYGIARELRAPRPTAVVVALAAVSIRPALGSALVDVLTDPACLAGFAAGTLFLLRHWRTGARSELVLSGLGFGIALGTKWYGLTDVPALVAVWVGAALLAGRPRRQLAADAGVLIGVIALAGGVWLLRNLVLTGNPVFDYKLSLFGATIFPAPPDPLRAELGYSLAQYFRNSGVLRAYVWPVIRADFGLTGALIAIGALGAGALSAVPRWRRRDHRRDVRVPLLAVGALLLAGLYSITPYSAQGFAGAPVLVNANTRYGMPAVLLAAPLLAWLAGRLGGALGGLRIALEAVLLACVGANLNRYLDAGTGRIVVTGLGIAILVAVVALRHAPLALRRAAALAAALACIGALAAYHYQRVLARRPYVPDDPTVAYVLARAPASARIGLTGLWTAQGLIPVGPLFGPRLRNQVSYIGPFVEHRLEAYKQPAAFVAALRRGHYDFLEVGTGFPPRPDPPEARWARAAGFVPVVSSGRLILMRGPGA